MAFSFTEKQFNDILESHEKLFADNDKLAKDVESLFASLKKYQEEQKIIGGLQDFFVKKRGDRNQIFKSREQQRTFGRILLGSWKAVNDKSDNSGDYLRQLAVEKMDSLPEWKQKIMSTTGTEGLLMLDDIDTTIHQLIEDHTFLSKEATWLTTDAHTMKFYKQISSVAVAPVSENQAFPETELDFSEIEATSKKVGGIIRYSREVDEEIFIDLGPFLAMDIIRTVAKEINRNAFVGDIALGDIFDGLLVDTDIPSHVLTTGNTQFSQADWTDYLKATHAIDEATDGKLMYLMHRTVFDHQKMAVNNNGDRLFQSFADPKNPSQLNGYKGKLLDFDLYTSSLMPADSASAPNTYYSWFGNMKNIRIIIRKALTIRTSDQLYMNYDQLATMFYQMLIIQKLHPTTGVRSRTAVV